MTTLGTLFTDAITKSGTSVEDLTSAGESKKLSLKERLAEQVKNPEIKGKTVQFINAYAFTYMDEEQVCRMGRVTGHNINQARKKAEKVSKGSRLLSFYPDGQEVLKKGKR